MSCVIFYLISRYMRPEGCDNGGRLLPIYLVGLRCNTGVVWAADCPSGGVVGYCVVCRTCCCANEGKSFTRCSKGWGNPSDELPVTRALLSEPGTVGVGDETCYLSCREAKLEDVIRRLDSEINRSGGANLLGAVLLGM